MAHAAVVRRTRQLLVVAALGCGPTRAPASETAEPGPEPGPAARAPVSRESFRSPSLRTVYAGRGWAALAVPGHLLVIEDDGHLVARDPTSGAVQWRTAVATRGPYAMFGVADVVVLQAGVVVTHVAVDTGAVLSTHSDSCRLRVRAGRGEVEPSRWVAGAAACAFQCRCGVRTFDCESGARGATLDTPVDRIACGEISVVFCDPRPEVLARSRTRVLALLDEEDQAALAGLDARSFTQVWSRRDLAPMARASGVGVDPDGRSCWVADAEAVEVFAVKRFERRSRAPRSHGTGPLAG